MGALATAIYGLFPPDVLIFDAEKRIKIKKSKDHKRILKLKFQNPKNKGHEFHYYSTFEIEIRFLSPNTFLQLIGSNM